MKHPLRLAGALLLALSASFHAAAETTAALRPEVGKPLKAAQELLQQHKYQEALAQVDAAAQAPNPSPYERYIIARMRAAAAAAAGDGAAAIAAFEAALASGQMPAAERAQTWQAIASIAYNAKNSAKLAEAVQQYRNAGGADAATLQLLPQALYQQGRYAEAAKEMSALVAAQPAGHRPDEAQLQFLASCAARQNNGAGYVAALTELVTWYPRDSYWQDLILRAASRPGFSERLRLDVYRLRRQTNTLDSADDFVEATELALQAGMTGEAQRFLEQGRRQGVLGKGAAAAVDRQNRLAAMVERKIAEDRAALGGTAQQAAAQPGGDALLNVGLDYVGYGEYDKGLPLMQQGLAKGGLKNPDVARLRYGAALLQAGRRDEAAKTLGGVRGTDGAADLARLWAIRAVSS